MRSQIFQYHPNFGYTFIPGIRLRIEHEGGGYLVAVNEAGFRNNREFEREKSPGIFRILLFGDSFSAGDGVSNRYRYGDILETLIPNLEVYNLALPGSGTDQQFLIFQEYAKYIEHDLVVIGLLVENVRRVAARYRIYDIGDVRYEIFAKPYFSLSEQGDLIRHHFPVPPDPVDEKLMTKEELKRIDRGGDWSLLRGLVNFLGAGLKNVVQRHTQYQPVPAYDHPGNPDWILLSTILERWISESEKPVVIFPIPLYQHIEETSPPTQYLLRLKELAQKTNVVIHDPLPYFWKTPKSERKQLRFEKDVHPTTASHLIMAESLKEAVMNFLQFRERQVLCR